MSVKVHCVLYKRVCIELGDYPCAIPLDRAIPSPGSSPNRGQVLQVKVKGCLRVKGTELLNRILVAGNNLLLAHNFACF